MASDFSNNLNVIFTRFPVRSVKNPRPGTERHEMQKKSRLQFFVDFWEKDLNYDN